MRKPLGPIRSVILKKNRREHLVECDESGALLEVTLCQKKYEAVARTASRPYTDPGPKTCPECRQQLRIRNYGGRSRASSQPELKVHYGEGAKPACGQDCNGEVTPDLELVTCSKCDDWLVKAGLRRRSLRPW